jgi:hypothetical protein
MIPVLISDTGKWLDRFAAALDQWEATIRRIHLAYMNGNHEAILSFILEGENVFLEVQSCKEQRQQLLEDSKSFGYSPRSLKEFAMQLDTQWPALWTHRLATLELQLDRIQQLSMSMWVSAYQSKSFVAELLMILSTGKSESATYSPTESYSLEGGYLVNEAA